MQQMRVCVSRTARTFRKGATRFKFLVLPGRKLILKGSVLGKWDSYCVCET